MKAIAMNRQRGRIRWLLVGLLLLATSTPPVIRRIAVAAHPTPGAAKGAGMFASRRRRTNRPVLNRPTGALPGGPPPEEEAASELDGPPATADDDWAGEEGRTLLDA